MEDQSSAACSAGPELATSAALLKQGSVSLSIETEHSGRQSQSGTEAFLQAHFEPLYCCAPQYRCLVSAECCFVAVWVVSVCDLENWGPGGGQGSADPGETFSSLTTSLRRV